MICHQLPNSRSNALRNIFEDLILLNYHLVWHHMILKAAWCIDTWRVDTILKGSYEPPHSYYDWYELICIIDTHISIYFKKYIHYYYYPIYFCIAFTYRHLLRPFPSSTLTSTSLSHTFQKYILFCTPINLWRNQQHNTQDISPSYFNWLNRISWVSLSSRVSYSASCLFWALPSSNCRLFGLERWGRKCGDIKHNGLEPRNVRCWI